jgi:hypothetical protein
MEGLMLHCGAEAISRHQLNDVLPGENLGRFHNPIPYAEFADQVAEQLACNGLYIHEEGYGVLNDGSKFFGLMEVSTDKPIEGEYIAKNDRGYNLTVGLRGSYDQTLPRQLAVGSRVFVCDNLCFSGQVGIKTKQTTNIRLRLPALIQNAVAQIPEMGAIQDRRFDSYKNTEIRPEQGDAALIELVRRGSLNPSHVGKAIREWDEPSHQEHTENGFSVWRLQNAVTEAIKPTPGTPAVLNAQNRTIGMTEYFDGITGFAA